jgi:DNA-binding PadR family transcriptional regulator
MNGSSTSRPSAAGPGTGIGRGLSALRSVLDEVRSPSSGRTDPGTHRDDVRAAVLTVLSEQPSDGYRIVRTLEERRLITPTPSAGAVYPTLQLLADQGLTTAEEADGRRTWTLTDAGRAAAEAARTRHEPTGTTVAPIGRRGAIARSGGQLAQAVALAVQAATPAQVGEVVDVLDDARRRILAILARS